MTIPPIFTIAFAVSSSVGFFIEGFRLDWNVVFAGAMGGVFSIVLWCLNRAWERRQQRRQEEAAAIDETVDERRMLMEEYARLRREERESTERIVAGYARIAETSRTRSHLIANGYMQFQLAHQELVELLHKHQVEVPDALLMKTSTANLLLQLEGVTESEAPAR